MENDPTLWQASLFLVGSYLVGSIPSAYLAGRWLKGIDVREFGSGNVGGSNVYHSVSRWAIVPVAIFDIGKAAVAAWLALYVLDWGPGMAMAAGLCVFIGHTWSLFLGFNGGRGISCIAGTLMVVFPLGALFLISLVLLGVLLKNTVTTSIALLLLPLLSVTLGEPTAITWGCVAFIPLVALKRLEGNRVPLPTGEDRWPVIWRRLLLDRDIADHKEWLARRPD